MLNRLDGVTCKEAILEVVLFAVHLVVAQLPPIVIAMATALNAIIVAMLFVVIQLYIVIGKINHILRQVSCPARVTVIHSQSYDCSIRV